MEERGEGKGDREGRRREGRKEGRREGRLIEGWGGLVVLVYWLVYFL